MGLGRDLIVGHDGGRGAGAEPLVGSAADWQRDVAAGVEAREGVQRVHRVHLSPAGSVSCVGSRKNPLGVWGGLLAADLRENAP